MDGSFSLSHPVGAAAWPYFSWLGCRRSMKSVPPLTLDVDVKLSYSVRPTLQAGFESYNGLGPVRHIGGLSDQDQMFYAVLDSKIRLWDLNFGVGRGLGGSVDRWVVKAIIGVPLR